MSPPTSGRVSECQQAVGIGVGVIAVGDALGQIPNVLVQRQVGDFCFVAATGTSASKKR